MIPAFFTICSANYIHYARVLIKSLRIVHPDAAIFVFLVEDIEPQNVSIEGARIIPVREIGIPGLSDMAFRYSVMELNTAVKPFCFRYLFEHLEHANAIYLDPDIFVLAPFSAVVQLFETGAQAVLTPHLLAPLQDGHHPSTLQIHRTGSYNLGFLGLQSSPEVKNFLTWWERELSDRCIVDLEGGIFVDQKFAELIPCFVGQSSILRHPGYNVAYWNFTQRCIERIDGNWTANGKPLVFFHFSGVVPGERAVFSKHQDRVAVSALGQARKLFEQYLDCLDRADQDRISQQAYTFGHFDDGTPIPKIVRLAARRQCTTKLEIPSWPPSRAEVCQHLRQHDANAFDKFGKKLNLLDASIWFSREDLQLAFPIQMDGALAGFCGWLNGGGYKELEVDGFHSHPEEISQSATYQLANNIIRIKNKIVRESRFARAAYQKVPRWLRRSIHSALLRSRPTIDTGSGLQNFTISACPKIDRPPGVFLCGYLNAETGVGEAARRAYRALNAAGLKVATRSLPAMSADSDSLDWTPASDSCAREGDILLSFVNADQMVDIERILPLQIIKNRYHIGAWAWELAEFPNAWLPALDYVHEVWTPSEFTADAVRAKTSKPVFVMPHPVFKEEATASELRTHNIRVKTGIGDHEYVFLFCFDFNSYLARKNPDAVLDAFERVVVENRDAHLIVKAHGRGLDGDARERFCRRCSLMPNVHLIDEVLKYEEMMELYDSADAFVSLHRSEGFGLAIADMMVRGKPVITTEYSGSADFANAKTAAIVNHKMVPILADDYLFGENQRWADAEIEHAAAIMGDFVQNPEIGREIGRRGQEFVSKEFSLSVVGERMRSRLEQIAQGCAR